MIDRNYQKTISIGVKVLKFIQLDPQKNIVKSSMVLTIIFLAVFYNIMLGYDDGTNTYKNFFDLVLNVSITLTVFIKLVMVIIMREKITTLIQNVDHFWSFDNTETSHECRKIMNAFNFLMQFFVSYCLVVLSICVALHLFYSETTIILIQYYRPRPISPKLFQACVDGLVIVYGFLVVGCDCLFTSSVVLLLVQFEILRQVFCDLFNKTPGTDQNNHQNKILKACVQHHSLLNRQVERISETFGIMILISLWISIVVTCMCLLDATTSSDQLYYHSIDTIKNILYILAYIVELFFLYFLPAQLLSNEIEKLPNSLYCTNWYNQSTTLKKSLQIILIRSQKNTSLTAGKIMKLNFETYAAVLKMYYSVFTFFTTTSAEL